MTSPSGELQRGPTEARGPGASRANQRAQVSARAATCHGQLGSGGGGSTLFLREEQYRRRQAAVVPTNASCYLCRAGRYALRRLASAPQPRQPHRRRRQRRPRDRSTLLRRPSVDHHPRHVHRTVTPRPSRQRRHGQAGSTAGDLLYPRRLDPFKLAVGAISASRQAFRVDQGSPWTFLAVQRSLGVLASPPPRPESRPRTATTSCLSAWLERTVATTWGRRTSGSCKSAARRNMAWRWTNAYDNVTASNTPASVGLG